MDITQNVTTALPKLPGYHFPDLHDRSTFKKSQTLKYNGGIASVVQRDATAIRSDKAEITKDDIFRVKPSWNNKNFHDKVVRFFGYFVEKLDEGASEQSIWYRKVCIVYFLVDGTIHIMEPDSLIKAPRFLSRQTVEGIRPETLRVGSSITVNQRTFYIYDCDAFTKDLYECLGKPQPPTQECPQNKFDVKELPNPKRCIEPGRRLASAVNRSLLENDKKVLRFNATWTDPNDDTRDFYILYYIADGTLSVQERIPPNSGRDCVGNFYKRSRLPKHCDLSAVTKGLDTISPKVSQEFYTHEDLFVGSQLKVLGRTFFIHDADPYTRDFYRDLGCELQPANLNQDPSSFYDTSKNCEVSLPPHLGFGSEEDSMGSVKYLMLKPPRKDIQKMLFHAKDVLRFRAKLFNACPEDATRLFVVCYYIADDTVSIFEQAGSNSGFSTGRFLSRQRVKISGPTEPAKYLSAHDLIAGTTVVINGHVFYLEEMDERTAKFLDGIEIEDVGGCVLSFVETLRDIVSKKYSRHTDAFRAYNRSKSRGLTIEELSDMFRDHTINITSSQIESVMKYLDADQDGFVGFGEFINVMMGDDNDKADSIRQKGYLNQKNAVSVKKNVHVVGANGGPERSSNLYRNAVQEVERKKFSDRVFGMLQTKLQLQRLALVDAFRIMSDKSPDALVGWNEFRIVVQNTLQLNLTQKEFDALCEKFFVSALDSNVVDKNRRLTIRDFQRLINQDIYHL